MKLSCLSPVTSTKSLFESGCLEGCFCNSRWLRDSVFILYTVVQFRGITVSDFDSYRESSHSSSRREDDALEDWQEEHLFAYLVQAVSWVCDLCGLLIALAEAKKMLGFCVAQRVDDQPFSFHCLLV